MCHRDGGKGDTKLGVKLKVPDFTNSDWQKKKSDPQIQKIIADGVPETKMKPWKDKLTDEEIDGLVKLLRTLK